jgi:hypothetical protein
VKHGFLSSSSSTSPTILFKQYKNQSTQVYPAKEYPPDMFLQFMDLTVGNVTNNQTYIGTYLSDELRQSRGNGTFETPDGQSIAWIYSAIGRLVDGHWVFHGIILFNNTQSESLSLLNNSIGLVKATVGNEPDYIWLLE